MKVLPSHTGEVTAAQTAHAATQLASAKAPGASSFASLLAQSTSTTATPEISLHKGESMNAVSGHSYAEIAGGKRDGMFVNTSNNKRRGQAFVLVHKHGREYHIYGTGKDRVVVALRKPSETHKTDTSSSATNTAQGTGGTTPTVSAS